MAMPPVPHQIVQDLAKALKPPAVGPTIAANTPAALAAAPAGELPELVTFTGFLGDTVAQPDVSPTKEWRVLYLDWQLQTWMLVEERGIVDAAKVADYTVPTTLDRDVIWVRSDASVVKCGGARQSVEAGFLTGEFTLAGDFDSAPSGGTVAAASTGVFCPTTLTCCRRMSQYGG